MRQTDNMNKKRQRPLHPAYRPPAFPPITILSRCPHPPPHLGVVLDHFEGGLPLGLVALHVDDALARVLTQGVLAEAPLRGDTYLRPRGGLFVAG